MGRALRVVAGGFAYHVLNRANARMRIFDKPKDYEAFEKILGQAVQRVKMRLLAYSLLPNHWHLVVWPREDGDLSTFVGWLELTHTQRWHAHRHSVGSGHVYQGRFKSFLVESDEYLWTVCRYVERNALRAGLCEARSNGSGPAFGGASSATRNHRRFCRGGRSRCRRTGSRASTGRKAARSLSRCGDASTAGSRSEARIGPSE